ncbi:MAG: diaminopimelate epimerase [Armatimonadetes bacterium]|nr:diaminopimelate epimerase [Armatimonadota bacterium]
MPELSFVKMHGAGNDFILSDHLDGTGPLDQADLGDLAVLLCERHFGIGADGLVLVLPSDSADYRMRIMNSDGSEAEMCGNAIRCFAKYLFDRGLAGTSLSVETLSGVKRIEVQSDEGKAFAATVNMGAPKLDASDIPVSGYEGRVILQPIEVDGRSFEITCVSMGIPHCVIFVDSADAVPLLEIGPRIETHAAFPQKTNVDFAQAVSRQDVIMRVWERGAGATLACGTGACATVVAGSITGKTDGRAAVHLPGGDLFIDWRDDGNVYMTGPAAEVYTGKISL